MLTNSLLSDTRFRSAVYFIFFGVLFVLSGNNLLLFSNTNLVFSSQSRAWKMSFYTILSAKQEKGKS